MSHPAKPRSPASRPALQPPPPPKPRVEQVGVKFPFVPVAGKVKP